MEFKRKEFKEQVPDWYPAYDQLLNTFMPEKTHISDASDFYGSFELTARLAEFLNEACGFASSEGVSSYAGVRRAGAMEIAERTVAGRGFYIDTAKATAASEEVMFDCMILATVASVTSPGSKLDRTAKNEILSKTLTFFEQRKTKYSEEYSLVDGRAGRDPEKVLIEQLELCAAAIYQRQGLDQNSKDELRDSQTKTVLEVAGIKGKRRSPLKIIRSILDR